MLMSKTSASEIDRNGGNREPAANPHPAGRSVANTTRPLAFISDGHDVSHLPGWVRAPKQITDGHLSDLAKAKGAFLATLDENIPGSYLIPK
jgi:hypothetical protein